MCVEVYEGIVASADVLCFLLTVFGLCFLSLCLPLASFYGPLLVFLSYMSDCIPHSNPAFITTLRLRPPLPSQTFDKCFLGSSETADANRVFCGQMGAVYLFGEALIAAQILAIYQLGPGYQVGREKKKKLLRK